MESVEFPGSLRTICQSSFSKCKSLRRVMFHDGLEILGTDEYTKEDKIQYGVFEESVVEKIAFPSTLRRIEYRAFVGCESLKNIVFPDHLEKIGLFAFFQTGLENIELPVSLRTVAQGAFAQCRNLRSVRFGEGLEIIGTDEYEKGDRLWYGTFENSVLEHIDLPSTLKRIEYNTFHSCKNLKSVALPDGLAYIGK